MLGHAIDDGGRPKQSSVMTLSRVGLFYRLHQGVLRYSRQKFWALKDISFDLSPGEVLGIIGKNGSGKSTLLKVMAGIISPDRGVVEYDRRLRVTLLSLQAGFNPHLSGRENIMINGMLLGVSRKQIRAHLDDIVTLADVGRFIDEPLRTYSTGMRARLGFATAFFADADVMLLDEILSVGDAAFKEKSYSLIREKVLSNKVAVLVSHTEHNLKELCDRLIWIDEGEVRAAGAAHEVWSSYRPVYRKRLGLD